MVQVLSYEVSSLPFSYLGVPVGCNMSHISNWKGVIDKFKQKLSSCKANCLSVGARLTMIKIVLGNLPTYYMSLYKISRTVEGLLESMRNSFFIVVI